MAKNKQTKKEKAEPNTIIFLVEGDSDTIALETPLSELIIKKYPDYKVLFLQQERGVTPRAEEIDSFDDDKDSPTDVECLTGGDITSSSYVSPNNIEMKIYKRFIQPATRRQGLYPKRIAKVIQIVDLDGVYIPNENVVRFSKDDAIQSRPYYDDNTRQILCFDPNSIIARNEQKRANLDFLLNLPDGKIKLKSKRVPYEMYFFSSNLDHFLHNNANVEFGKRKLANDFVRKYGIDLESFMHFFHDDEAAIGCLGYKESWNLIKEGENSIMRYTNIDCLINSLLTD